MTILINIITIQRLNELVINEIRGIPGWDPPENLRRPWLGFS